MTIFYGARDMDDAPPRPIWLWARDALRLALALVCAVEIVAALWPVMP